MLKKIAVFFLMSILAYTLNVNLNFPWLTGTLFGIALFFALRNSKEVSNLRIGLVTIIWSTLVFIVVAFGVLLSIKEVYDGIALTNASKFKVGLTLGLFNGIGFALLKNLLLGTFKLSKYHFYCIGLSFLVGFIVAGIITNQSDYNAFLSAHIIWFLATGFIITKNVNHSPVVLLTK